MRNQRRTFPIQNKQQQPFARPLPPRTIPNAKIGFPRHGRSGAR
ncbi:hypothetical protein [Nocardia sp. NPDC056000]